MSSVFSRRLAGVRGQCAKVVVTHDDAVVTSWPLECEQPDLGTIEQLAHLALAARRIDCRVHVEDATEAFVAVLELVGLADLLVRAAPTPPPSALGEVLGQPEDTEEPGVDEVVVPDDPVA